MLIGLVGLVAGTFQPETWDIEVLEAHHRRKIDAPSGTALMLAKPLLGTGDFWIVIAC